MKLVIHNGHLSRRVAVLGTLGSIALPAMAMSIEVLITLISAISSWATARATASAAAEAQITAARIAAEAQRIELEMQLRIAYMQISSQERIYALMRIPHEAGSPATFALDRNIDGYGTLGGISGGYAATLRQGYGGTMTHAEADAMTPFLASRESMPVLVDQRFHAIDPSRGRIQLAAIEREVGPVKLVSMRRFSTQRSPDGGNHNVESIHYRDSSGIGAAVFQA